MNPSLSRLLYFILAWCFVALGIVGAFLPVLPTTPFMILALWGFSKSSRRFHHWLYHHKIFGPTLQKWDKHRVIPLKAKQLSSLIMGISLVFIYLNQNIPTWAKVLTTLIMLYGVWYIWTKPSRIISKS